MGPGAVCVGGLNLETNQNIRLYGPGGMKLPLDVKFNVGQIWDMEFHERSRLIPPHVEDVIVDRAEFICQQGSIYEFLMQRIQPWIGGPEALFGGFLTSYKKSAYISQKWSLPNCSVGFWLPNMPLKRTKIPRYYVVDVSPDVWDEVGLHTKELMIPYKGFSSMLHHIHAGTLLRVSLARWYQPDEADEAGCCLQLSGWYL